MAVDPANGQTVYAGTEGGGLFKSTNGGGSWSRSGPTEAFVRALAIAPTQSQIVYTGYHALFQSSNGGTTWSLTSLGVPYNVSSLAIDPADSQTVYAGTEGGGVMKTANGGVSWSSMHNGLLPSDQGVLCPYMPEQTTE